MEEHRRRGRGLRREPPGGWPLDRVLVGVGTLRTFRELALEYGRPWDGPKRAWDVALWSGVTPQGSTQCMERIHRAGLVVSLPPDRPWRARRYRLDVTHPLCPHLIRLFRAEEACSR